MNFHVGSHLPLLSFRLPSHKDHGAGPFFGQDFLVDAAMAHGAAQGVVTSQGQGDSKSLGCRDLWRNNGFMMVLWIYEL